MMEIHNNLETPDAPLPDNCPSGSTPDRSGFLDAASGSSQSVFAWIKWGFTAFMVVLVPYYWMEYGPTNFLYFCDIALFLTLASLWTRRSLLASMALVGLLIPQLGWQVDFLVQCLGLPNLGLTDYMFDPSISIFARFLSFFHFWLPILLLYIVYQLGFDRRSIIGWTLIAWVAMLVSYALLPAPGDVLDFPNQPYNVNYVYGFSPDSPQTMLPQQAWLMVLMIGLPALVYCPTFWLLQRWMPRPKSRSYIADRTRSNQVL